MEKITRTVKAQVVTVTDRNGVELDSYAVQRKTDVVKEMRKAIKKLNRVDLDVTINIVEDKYEMPLETFLEHATKVEPETEAE